MGTTTESKQVRAEKRRRRHRARAERRRRVRALVPVAAAQRLGIRVVALADAMRQAGVTAALTEAQAQQWVVDPTTAPESLMQLRDERLAAAAQAEYKRQREAERQELHELAAEQSALAKVQAGKRRFNDDDRRVLRAVGVDADDHHRWPVHAGGCDGVGPDPCVVRLERLRARRRADALIDSVAKETALRGLAVAPGQFVTTWHSARVGLVVKVNKVSVKVRMVGGRAERHAVVEKNLDPRYVDRGAPSLPAPPKPGDAVALRDHGGHIRRAQVVEVDDPLFEATFALKSGQWRSGWFDLAAIQPCQVGAP